MNFFKFRNRRTKSNAHTGSSNTFLLKMSSQDIESVYGALNTQSSGLTSEEAEHRLETVGRNDVAQDKPPAWYTMLLTNFKNPFVLVLIILGLVSYFSGDLRATIVVLIMVVISIVMRFLQEYRSSRAAEALRQMVQTKATVKRSDAPENEQNNQNNANTKPKPNRKSEIPIEELVPGDIVYLSAGDMVPADVRLIRSKDLFIGQSALTGESMPVEKFDEVQNNLQKSEQSPLERQNLCFMGTSVVSGFAKTVVIATGSRTLLGSLAKNVIGYRPPTSFDLGINKVTLILVRFILVMIPIVFIINGLDKGDWKEAFLFAIAVAVGLTPEMLPMIVTANLAKGAVAMSHFKVIVKRLNAIQSFGAINILCTDKTGTLTQDKIILEKYLDVTGEENQNVLEYGYLNSHFQSGLKNMLDMAILDHVNIKSELNIQEDYKKIDEIPFDFSRKRVSVVLSKEAEDHILICKGAVEELLKVCSLVQYPTGPKDLDTKNCDQSTNLANELSDDGFRVIAVASKKLPLSTKAYAISDENNLTFIGLMAFLDPPKETASEAIQILMNHGVMVKVLTGDNDLITKHVCKEVNLPHDKTLLGSEIESMDDGALSLLVESTNIFAKLTPLQKARIIKLLQKNGHVVGFLGDGINDAPGLREADVGISVDTATDIARESADIILLEKSLLVLGEGVIKGREVYGNIIKYIKMTTSSNFGNVLSVLVASAFLPFLPMLPLQLLIQNLFYDFSQLSIPWDHMDKEFLKKARTWDPSGIARFMIFIGPISSIFDMTTFLLLWYVFQANAPEYQAFFQSGWFVEGLISQTLIVHMIRTTKIPFIQSTASLPVIVTTVLIIGIGLYLPFSEFGASVQFVPLPGSYFIWLFFTLLSYCVLTQMVKVWYIKKFKSWL